MVKTPIKIILRYTQSADYLKAPEINSICLETIKPDQENLGLVQVMIHKHKHLLTRCGLVNNSTPKQVTLSMFCNLSKSFDVLKTDTLLNKLNYYGIRGVAN